MVTLQPDAEAVARRLCDAGHRVYIVGGAVRDALMGRESHDADLATTARPEQVLAAIPTGVADGAAFGRILVGAVDVVTLRRDGIYRDARRPSSVEYTNSIEEDLARRDFTVNAMAVEYGSDCVIDPFGGQRDLAAGVLRCVGDPAQRFREDALRMMRAVRFVGTLGLSLDQPTAAAVGEYAQAIRLVSPERVRDELSRLLVGQHAAAGLRAMRDTGLLAAALPELAPMAGCPQRNPHHHHDDVFKHTIAVVEAIAPTLPLRLAALLHDCGKPATRVRHADGVDTFYGHEEEGSEVAAMLLNRLAFPKALAERVVRNVRHHMFRFGPEAKDAAVRRFIARVGIEAIPDLLDLRAADVEGSGEADFGDSSARLRRVMAAGEAGQAAFGLRDLAVRGNDVVSLGFRGREIGTALQQCLDAVLENPTRNTREALLEFLATSRA